MHKYIDLIANLRNDYHFFLASALIFFLFDSYCIVFLQHNLFSLIEADLLTVDIKLIPIVTSFVLLLGVLYYLAKPVFYDVISVFLYKLAFLLIVIVLKINLKAHRSGLRSIALRNEAKKLLISVQNNNILGMMDHKVRNSFEELLTIMDSNKLLTEIKDFKEVGGRLLLLAVVLLINFVQGGSIMMFFGEEIFVMKIIYFICIAVIFYRYVCTALVSKVLEEYYANNKKMTRSGST